MRRALPILFALALARQADGETLRLCHSTATLDDIVRLTLVIDDPESTAEQLEIPVPDGLVVATRKARRDTEFVTPYPGAKNAFGSPATVPKPTVTIELLLRPTREGSFVIGPLEIPHPRAAQSRAAPVTLRVVPNLELSGMTYAAAIRALEKAGRARVHFTASAPRSCYVGEQVTVSWTVGSMEALEDVTIVEDPVIDEAVIPSAPLKRFVSGGEASEGLSFRGVRTASFYASVPGPLRVGPMTIRAFGRSRDTLRENETGAMDQRLEVVRSTPAFTIDVRPLPEGVPASAVGRLSLDCSSLSARDGAWTATARVEGNASLLDDVRPRWSSPIEFSAQLTLEHVRTSYRGPRLVREQLWVLRIPAVKHGSDVMLPSLVVDWFDPASGKLAQSSCWEPQRLRLLTELAARPPAQPQLPSEPPPASRWRWLHAAAPLLKPVVIIAAITLLLLQLRRSAE